MNLDELAYPENIETYRTTVPDNEERVSSVDETALEKDIEAVKKSARLRRADLDETKLSKAGADNMRQTLPQLAAPYIEDPKKETIRFRTAVGMLIRNNPKMAKILKETGLKLSSKLVPSPYEANYARSEIEHIGMWCGAVREFLERQEAARQAKTPAKAEEAARLKRLAQSRRGR